MSGTLPSGYQLMNSMTWIITAVRSGFRRSRYRDIERLICGVPDRHLRAMRTDREGRDMGGAFRDNVKWVVGTSVRSGSTAMPFDRTTIKHRALPPRRLNTADERSGARAPW